jgi:hypothetical protein
MNLDKFAPRLLGAAFLIVAVGDVLGTFLLGTLKLPLIGPTDNISETMIHISNNSTTMLFSIIFLLIESMFIVLMAVLLYTTLKKQNKIIALWGFGLMILEAASLAISRMSAFSLLKVSQEYVKAGTPDSTYFQTLGSIYFESAQFGYGILLMLFFSIGLLLFYYLFLKSKYIPKVFPVWGIIATSLSFIGTVFVLFGYNVSMFVFIPILPLELAIGVWLMVKGFKSQEIKAKSG